MFEVICDLDCSCKVTHLDYFKSQCKGLYVFQVWWKLLDWVKSYKMFSFLGEKWFFWIAVSQQPLVALQPQSTGTWIYILRSSFHLFQVSITSGSWDPVSRLVFVNLGFSPLYPFPRNDLRVHSDKVASPNKYISISSHRLK
jgi:hypothetical protein